LNISFLTIIFILFQFSLEIIISIDLIVGFMMLIIYSFFPNVRMKRLIQIVSYFFIITGIFLLIYFILINLIQNILITINLTSIIISGTLFSSKYLKINQKIMHFIISIIFIINISLLTFFTLSLVPNLILIAIFMAISVFGASLLIFNK
jgi:hypothetical protein